MLVYIMLGEVVKFIMSIVGIVSWFIEPRLKIKPKEEEPMPPPPLQIPEEEELLPPPQTPRWSKKTQQFWSDKLGKNPAYKSSNGF